MNLSIVINLSASKQPVVLHIRFQKYVHNHPDTLSTVFIIYPQNRYRPSHKHEALIHIIITPVPVFFFNTLDYSPPLSAVQDLQSFHEKSLSQKVAISYNFCQYNIRLSRNRNNSSISKTSCPQFFPGI